MRREKYTLLVVLHLTLGSPPHAQGKECSFERFYVQPGITPACAGKSPKESHQIPPSQDHPRMRREKGRAAAMSWYRRGSPPHAQGKGLTACCFCWSVRITPACAGKRHKVVQEANGH